MVSHGFKVVRHGFPPVPKAMSCTRSRAKRCDGSSGGSLARLWPWRSRRLCRASEAEAAFEVVADMRHVLKASYFPWVSGGFLERRIPGKNGEGTPRTIKTRVDEG